MSGQGYNFVLDKTQTDALLACPDASAVLDITDQLVDAFDAAGEGCGGDKDWHVLHYCLSNGMSPLKRCFVGGRLLVGDGAVVNLLTPGQVREAAAALAGLDGAWFRRRFVERFGAEYGGDLPEEDLERFGGLFEDMQGFYAQAAAQGMAVVFVTDETLDAFSDPP